MSSYFSGMVEAVYFSVSFSGSAAIGRNVHTQELFYLGLDAVKSWTAVPSSGSHAF